MADAAAIQDMLANPGRYSVLSKGQMWVPLTDILAADRLAQRERHAALAREIGGEPGEAIVRAILEDGA